MPCEQKSGISYTVRCIGFISVCHNDSLRHYGEADAFSVLPASALWLPMHCYYSLYVKLNRVLRRRWWHPTPVLSPGKSHGRRSLVGCSPWGCEELDMTEQLPFHFPLSCIGDGNGNPLQCSCLRIPGTGEAGGLPSMGSHRVGHDWSDLAAAAAAAAAANRVLRL